MIRTIKIIQAPRLAKLFEKCYLDIGWCRALLTTLSYWASLYTDLFTSGAIFSIIVQNLVPKLFTPSCQFFQTDIYQWHFAPRPPQPQHTYYDENRAIGCQLNRKGVNNWQLKIDNCQLNRKGVNLRFLYECFINAATLHCQWQWWSIKNNYHPMYILYISYCFAKIILWNGWPP